jgi:hypothetical protein
MNLTEDFAAPRAAAVAPGGDRVTAADSSAGAEKSHILPKRNLIPLCALDAPLLASLSPALMTTLSKRWLE